MEAPLQKLKKVRGHLIVPGGNLDWQWDIFTAVKFSSVYALFVLHCHVFNFYNTDISPGS